MHHSPVSSVKQSWKVKPNTYIIIKSIGTTNTLDMSYTKQRLATALDTFENEENF